jgi:hypothetical protein
VTVRNVPSDGAERPVADGLFVYSTAAAGPAVRLVSRPARLDLLVKAKEGLELRAVDRAGNPAPLPLGKATLAVQPNGLAAAGPGLTLLALRPGAGTARVTLGKFAASVPLTVLAEPAHLAISPADANPSPGETIALQAVARDAAGDPLALGEGLRWSASSGEIAGDGRFRAGTADATVVARIGSRAARTTILVGRRTEALALFGAAGAPRWTFATAPRGGSGAATVGADGVTLTYDFSGPTRAAYANTDLPLGGVPLALSLEVRGDGNGAALRAAFRNPGGERIAATLAKRIDWSGWRTCRIRLPRSASRLISLYLVGSLGGPRVRATGTIALRDVRITLAGSARSSTPP